MIRCFWKAEMLLLKTISVASAMTPDYRVWGCRRYALLEAGKVRWLAEVGRHTGR